MGIQHLAIAVVVHLFGAVLGFVVLSASAEAAVQIGQNFTGSKYGIDSGDLPPDTDGAAGPQHFVEFINGRFSVYDKANGNRLHTMSDVEFWKRAGLTFAWNIGVSDPRLLFDQYSQHWFASMVDFSESNHRRQPSNHFLLAVSQTADPTGGWTAFSFASDPNGVNFADFPTLGIDQSAVYLSADMFDGQGKPLAPSLVLIPREDLLANPASIAGLTYLTDLSYSAQGDVLQPAVCTGTSSAPEVLVAVGNLGFDLQPHGHLMLSTLSSGSTALLASPSAVLDVTSYTAPIGPSQPDGSTNLDSGDSRFSAAVRRVGDLVYATHTVEVDHRSAVRWYKIDASGGNLVQSETIIDPDLDLFYPSIAANEAGTVVIGCNGSSAHAFISSYAVVGQTTNGTLTFGRLMLLKAGSASYSNLNSAGTTRWGDYSATSVDPADPTRFWTIQMIPIGNTTWATQITEILTGGSTGLEPTPITPSLAITLSGADLVVSWPGGTSSAFQLQSSSGLDSSSLWAPVSQTPRTVGGINQITLPASSNVGFFRLIDLAAPVNADSGTGAR